MTQQTHLLGFFLREICIFVSEDMCKNICSHLLIIRKEKLEAKVLITGKMDK